MSDTVTTLGVVGILPVGDWSNSSAYDRLNAVKYQGSMYVALKDVPAGTVPTNTTYWMLMAEKGESVQSVEKTGTSGLVDTYTMTMSSGRTFTYTVTNGEKGDTGATGATGATGNGIQSIYLTGTSGLVDTYTILYTNGQTTEFEVTNGTLSPSDVNPLMNGTADPGTSNLASRGDHVHPSDTSKANTDGYYQQMTVGNAEQLVSTVFIEDKIPYIFRTSGGNADIGDREYDEIVGGTVAWNQLVQNGDFINGTNWSAQEEYASSILISAGVARVTITSGAPSLSCPALRNTDQFLAKSGHKYLLTVDMRQSVNGGNPYFRSNALTGQQTRTGYTLSTSWQTIRSIVDATSDNVLIFYVGSTGASTYMSIGDYIEFRNYYVIDLTQMFGSTIADYIYALEQNNAGTGVAWFRKLFPKDYYAYNTGQLMSVKTSAHKMVGFNAYDHANTSAKVVGGNQYQITGTYTSISLDGTAITPDSDGYFTPSVSGTLSVVGGNATDTCIHLVWDGERDGEYEPYELHSYPLDSDLELRGIPKLDANNQLCYDGDEYEADGTVTRRFVEDEITISQMYSRPGNDNVDFAVFDLSNAWANLNNINNANIYRKQNVTFDSLTETGVILTYSGANKQLAVSVAKGTTKAQARDIYNGKHFLYQVATPTTESAEPYTELQTVDNFGTEEYVVIEQSGVAVPVGHNTKYAHNLRAKLEMMPESPSGDGDYIVRQTDGENGYVALSSNATVSGLTTRCPVCPTDTDGTYILKATVSGGAVVYSWEAQS